MRKLIFFMLAILYSSTIVVQATDYYVAHSAELGGYTWSNNKELMTDAGDGSYFRTYFAVPANSIALKVTMDGGWDNQLNYAARDEAASNVTLTEGNDNNICFTTSSLQNVTVWCNSTKVWIVVSDPKFDVLNGAKVMFYYGSPTGWTNRTMYFLLENKTPDENGYALSGYAQEWKSGSYSAVGLYPLNSSANYRLSNNNTWSGNEKTGLAAGCFADMSGDVTQNSSFVCTLGSTSYSMNQGDASVTVTSTVSGTSGLGLSYTLEHYYISIDGTTWSVFDPSSTSSLAQGSYTIKALATDGHIYLVSTNSATLTVNPPAAGSHNITATTATKWTYGSLPGSELTGETVEFTVTPFEGYTVEVTSSDATITKNGNTYSFTMPDNDVAITVTPTALSYNIIYPASPSHYTLAGGNPATGNTDATINFTATPDANYFLAVTVNGVAVEGVNNVYSFTMPAEAVTVAISASTYRSFDGSTPIYLNGAAVSWWLDAGAVQKATFTKSDESTIVVTGVLEEGSVYAYIPEAGAYKSVQFSRHNPSNVSEDWGHTDHISLIGTDANNYVNSFAQNSTEATWSTFTPTPSYTFTNGTTIYIDFTAMTEGATGVNYPNANEATLGWKGDGAGTVIPVTFTANVKWITNQVFIKTEKTDWANQNFIIPGTGNNCVVVAADGASYSWTTIVPPPPTIALHSNLTNPEWESSADFTVASGNATASLTMTISQGNSYEFGVKVDGDWRSNGSAFDRFNNSAAIPAGNTSNCTFVADATGDYTFTWTYATNTLSVEYPEALSVALTGLAASQFVGDVVTVGASSNLTNPSYVYQLKINDGEFAALATNPYTFASAGTYTFKVTATGDEGSVAATKEVAVYAPLTLYFINKDAWTNPTAYAYGTGDIKNAAWPGEAMTATGDATAGHSYGVYSIIIAKNRYSNIIFSDNGANQTGDLTFDEATPYYYNGAWYATLAECDPASADVTYHLYVREYVGWTDFYVYAWGDKDFFGGWPGQLTPDNTATIDGVTYNVYDYEAPADAAIQMHLIFNNNGPGEGQEGDYRQLLDITTAKNCTISVNDFAAWEGLAGEKRFRPCLPLAHVYGYQYNEYGTVGDEWPGAELTPDAEGWYSYVVSKGGTVIFNNGTGADAMQTGDFAYTDADPVADECAAWHGVINVSGEPAKTYMFTENDCDATCAPVVNYTRETVSGRYGTICLPLEDNTIATVTGATVYSIAGKEEGKGLYLEPESRMVAGKPYFFLANGSELNIHYLPAENPSATYSNLGLVGNATATNLLVLDNDNNYILYNNLLYFVDSEAYAGPYCAYVAWNDVPVMSNPSMAPSHMKLLGVRSTPTSIEVVGLENADTRKVLIDGQLYIIHNNQMYNVTGQIVK